ncbi:unnamed protein product [Mytilus edulis]|uniref:Uncharacterized protein n=1 Tax=Mytilus edulis TaxID=6550 RepID=A0A8S3QIQ4_MYTED|nr:unnamed protein product [Mytilus edulis]
MSLLERKLLQLALLVVIWSVVMKTVSGDCCRKPFRDHCRDCTPGTPCCGIKKCNIFCCGCKCRTEPRGKHCFERGTGCRCYNAKRKRRHVSNDTTDISAYLTFIGLDINKNGIMEECEFKKALEHMHITDNMTVLHHWSIMDEDKDGIISMEEFDRQK